MTKEDLRERGKLEVAYDRKLVLKGKEAADLILYFWMQGFTSAMSDIKMEDLIVLDKEHDSVGSLLTIDTRSSKVVLESEEHGCTFQTFDKVRIFKEIT